MTAAANLTVLNLRLAVRQGGEEQPVQIAGSFDRITTQDAARAAGKAMGDQIADNLCQRLQHGEVLK